MLGVSNIAKYQNDGTLLDRHYVKVPYELKYESPQHFLHEKEFDADGN